MRKQAGIGGVGKGLENQTSLPMVSKVQLGSSVSPDGSSPVCASSTKAHSRLNIRAPCFPVLNSDSL